MTDKEDEEIKKAFAVMFGPYETYRDHRAWAAVFAAFRAGWKSRKRREENGSAAASTPLSDNGSQPPNPRENQ